jgi:hypothetical protein
LKGRQMGNRVDYAQATERVVAASSLRADMLHAAGGQAAGFNWERTADWAIEVDNDAARMMRDHVAGASR